VSSCGLDSVLGLKYFEVIENDSAGVAGHDDIIHVSTLGSLQGVGKSVLVFSGFLLAVLSSEDDLNCTLSSHNGDLSGGPSVVIVTVQVLGGHNVVSTSISLTGNEVDLGDGGLSIGEEKLCTVLDDTSELLDSSGEEPGHISECDKGDLESITETNEASSLNGSINIEATSENLRLVSNDTNNAALNLTEAGDDVLCILGHQLVEVIAIDDVLDDELHVVGLVGVKRNDIVKESAVGLVATIGFSPYLMGSLILVGLRQVSHELSCALDGLNIVVEGAMTHTRDLTVHLSSSKFLLGDGLLSDSLDYIGSSNEHIRGDLNHESEISECG